MGCCGKYSLYRIIIVLKMATTRRANDSNKLWQCWCALKLIKCHAYHAAHSISNCTHSLFPCKKTSVLRWCMKCSLGSTQHTITQRTWHGMAWHVWNIYISTSAGFLISDPFFELCKCPNAVDLAVVVVHDKMWVYVIRQEVVWQPQIKLNCESFSSFSFVSDNCMIKKYP